MLKGLIVDENKPGWGKVIGTFFLCGCLAVGACILTSSAFAHNMGLSGYSNGGLTGTITGIACAAYYRSKGKLAGPAIAAVVVGMIIGVLVVQLAVTSVR